LLERHIEDHDAWRTIRRHYWSRVDDTPDGEFAKTFFNSVYRDVLRSLDIDPTQVSDTADVVSPDPPLRHPARLRNYINWTSACDVVSRLLADFRFDTPYSDLAGDAAFVCAELATLTASEGDPDDAVRR